MRSISITATITLSLLVATSYGGVVRRSIPSSIKNGKDLLSMKGASDAIKRSFKSAGKELEELSDKLEKEVKRLVKLSAYINETQAQKITDALAEAKNINSLMNDQRVELAGLAKTTITQTDRIVQKIKDIVAEDREFDSGMRSMLRSMKSLLKTSERKLDLAKKNIDKLREKVNAILATLETLKGLVEGVQEKEEALASAATAKDVGKIIEGLAKDTTETILKGTENKASSANTASIVQSAFSGIARFAVSLVKVLQRPDVAQDLEDAVTEIGKAIDIIEKQKGNMNDEYKIITQWRDAVEKVKNDVFDTDFDTDEEDLVDNIKEIISDPRDINEIYEAFGDLRSAASAYIRQVKQSCPSCVA